jgi:hypothetical protein
MIICLYLPAEFSNNIAYPMILGNIIKNVSTSPIKLYVRIRNRLEKAIEQNAFSSVDNLDLFINLYIRREHDERNPISISKNQIVFAKCIPSGVLKKYFPKVSVGCILKVKIRLSKPVVKVSDELASRGMNVS